VNALTVSLDGAVLVAGATADFTWTGTTLTLTMPAYAGQSLRVAYSGSLSSSSVPDGSVVNASVAVGANIDSDKLGYLSTATGSVSRTVEAKLGDVVSVKDFGAVGGGVADDTAAIQAAIDANPSKNIFFPPGTYKVAGTITITSSSALVGAGAGVTSISQMTGDVDTFLFKPTTAGSTSAYLNNPRISGISVNHTSVAAASTLGAGIRFLQCNGYKLFDCTVSNAPEGITIQGGQFGSLKSFQIYASSGLTATADSALLYLRQAPYGGSLYQPCYTVEIEDFRMSATLLRETCIYIRNVDGATFSNGYVAYGGTSLVKIKAERDSGYVSGVSFVNTYLDCVNTSSTPYGISIPTDGFTSAAVYDVRLGAGSIIGNGSQSGIITRKPEVYNIIVAGALILNMSKWAIDVEGSAGVTNLHITGATIQNCGDLLSGSVTATAGRLLNISGSMFNYVNTKCVVMAGSWNQGVISGCSNSSNVPDITNTATFTNGLALGANSSAYTGAGANKWVGVSQIFATATLDFPSTAVGAAATLTMTVTGAAVGDPVTVSVSGSTNIVNTGTAFFLFVGGVTATDTVSIRAYNLSGATSDPAALFFNVVVHKASP
jgi:hypothetical protein